MNFQRTLDANSEVISLTEVKNQLRITTTADDNSLRLFIAAARHKVENYLGRTLVTSTWEYKLDYFQEEIKLPMGPVQSITTISYVDTDGNNQTFTDFQFDRYGRLKPSYGNSWPTTRDQYDAVTITYIAGETHPGDVPEDIKHALLLLVGASDIGREDSVIGAGIVVSELPSGSTSLLQPHRRWNL